MFDSLFPEATENALRLEARRPPGPRPEVPWFKDAWSAIGKAVPRAGAEMGRAMSSLMTPEAVGAMDAPTMFSAPGQTSKPQAEQDLRRQDAAIRDAIKEMTPDAETTGAASMILHDVTRFVGKAAAYGTLGGVPGAVAGMTLDEGYNEAARRMDEGVDPATAAKLGVVKGVSSGLAVALPVAGRTLAQTAGLALFGGPAAYVGEQLTARDILATAGYDEQANEIDPFDPLGLGVAFFGSFLFGAGAHAMRGRRPQAAGKVVDSRPDAPALDSAARAAPAADPLPLARTTEVPPGELTPTAAAARAYTQEQVDVAHVTILQGQRDATALHRADDIASSAGHARALDQAMEQLATGQRVSVTDVAPVVPADPAVYARLDEVEALRTEIAGLAPVAGELAERGAIRRIREEIKELERTRPPEGAAAERELAKEIQGQRGVSYKAALGEAKQQIAGRLADHQASIDRLQQAVERNARAQQATQRIGEAEQRIAGIERELGPNAKLARFERAIATAAADHVAALPKVPAAPRARTVVETPPRAAGAAPATPEAQARGVKQEQGAVKQEPGAPVDQASPEAAAYVDAESARIEQTDPDMLVLMEGMDEPVPVRELLAEARAIAAQEVADAPLLRVAAECALRG